MTVCMALAWPESQGSAIAQHRWNAMPIYPLLAITYVAPDCTQLVRGSFAMYGLRRNVRSQIEEAPLQFFE